MTVEVPAERKTREDGQGSVRPERTPRQEYNADAKAKEREAAPITIGGKVFNRRRKNWKVTRDLRALLRVQERSQIKGNRLAKQLEELPAEARDEEIQQLEDQIDAHQDESDEAAYKIIALLLRDENGQEPTLEHLKGEGDTEGLDVEDAGALAQMLAGGGEQAGDPTQTPSS